jgi:DNA-binding SARP family transcriptional activator/TolB-like protein/Tfp pilus assembly protein PilF
MQDSEPVIALRLLGTFALTIDEREIVLPRKAQALMAWLALRHHEWQGRDAIAEVLWANRSADQIRQSLRQCLWIIRQNCDCDVLEARRGFLRLPASGIVIDALKFEALAAANGDESGQGAKLYRGELLEGLPFIAPRFDEWLSAERARFSGLAATIFTSEAEKRAAARDFDSAIVAARRLLSLDDLNERSHRLLMSLLARAGHRSQALEQFDACVTTLRRELGIAPEAETVELASSITSTAVGPSFSTPPAARDVRNIDASPPPSKYQAAGKSRRIVPAFAFLACAVGVAGAMTIKLAAPLPLPAIAIASFANHSGLPGEADAISGMVELLAERLQDTHALRVRRYREDQPFREQIVADPNAAYIIEGGASFVSGLEVTFQLSDRKGVNLWSQHYEVSRADVFKVTEDAAMHVSRAVTPDLARLHSDQATRMEPEATRELLTLATYMRHEISASSVVSFHEIAEQVVKHDPSNAEGLALLANASLQRFSVGLMTADLDEARQEIDHSLALDPMGVTALWDRCYLLRLEHHFEDALEACRRVLDLNSQHPGALREVGHDLLALQDPDGALAWLRKAIAVSPEHAFVDDAYLGIAEGEVQLGQPATAIASLRTSLDHDHWGSPTGLWLSAVLAMTGADSEAKSVLIEFFKRHPEFPSTNVAALAVVSALGGQPKFFLDGLHRLGLTEARAEDK